MSIWEREMSRRAMIQTGLAAGSLAAVYFGTRWLTRAIETADRLSAQVRAYMSPEDYAHMTTFQGYLKQTFRGSADPFFWKRIGDPDIYKEGVNGGVFAPTPLISPREETESKTFRPGVLYQLSLPSEGKLPPVKMEMEVQGELEPSLLKVYCSIDQEHRFQVEQKPPLDNISLQECALLQQEMLDESYELSPEMFVQEFPGWFSVAQPPSKTIKREQYLVAAVSKGNPPTTIYWGMNRNFKIASNLLMV